MCEGAETDGSGDVHRTGGRGRIRFRGTVQCRRSLTENLEPPSPGVREIEQRFCLEKTPCYIDLAGGTPEPSSRPPRSPRLQKRLAISSQRAKRCYVNAAA